MSTKNLSMVTGLTLPASFTPQVFLAAIFLGSFGTIGIGGCSDTSHAPGIPGFSAPSGA